MVSIAELDSMPQETTRELLAACCGSTQWVESMVNRRPFRSPDALFFAADEALDLLRPEDWLEAFEHHPRIGSTAAAVPQGTRSRGWSASEQRGTLSAAPDIRDELAEINDRYEQRFGYIYIVCATGRSAQELLDTARERLRNEPRKELGIAAVEQRKITHLRLRKLLGMEPAA